MFESGVAPRERSPYGGKEIRLNAFTDKGLSLDVRVDPDEDTVWLTKDQMAMLFDRDRSVISRHIKSIYKKGELAKLSEKSTCAFFARVPSTRKRSYKSVIYNLDVPISVGYRVKSGRDKIESIFAEAYV